MSFRSVAKALIYGFAHVAGLPALGRRGRRGGLIVLTYHSFGPAAEHPYLHRLAIEQARSQFAHLARNYDVVDLEAGLARLQHEDGADARRPMAAISVDDGYGDNHRHLFPLLEEAKLPATIFLATDYLDSGRLPWPTRLGAMLHFATAVSLHHPLEIALSTPEQRLAAGRVLRRHFSALDHDARDAGLAVLERALAPRAFTPLSPLSWDEVRKMAARGMRFGAHTHYHGWLDRLTPTEVAFEFESSRRRIEQELQRPCRGLAYPNGNWTPAIAEAARSAGFAYALTQERGINRSRDLDLYALRRIEVPFDERIGTFACRAAGVAL